MIGKDGGVKKKDRFGSGWEQYSNETPGYIKCGEFLLYLGDLLASRENCFVKSFR
jgi:hypothetical protein